jgi:hypothetical protein
VNVAHGGRSVMKAMMRSTFPTLRTRAEVRCATSGGLINYVVDRPLCCRGTSALCRTDGLQRSRSLALRRRDRPHAAAAWHAPLPTLTSACRPAQYMERVGTSLRSAWTDCLGKSPRIAVHNRRAGLYGGPDSCAIFPPRAL